MKDSDEVMPDGSTVRGRLQTLVLTISEDLKACANATDTYRKKKLIGEYLHPSVSSASNSLQVKVIKGPIWEGKLLA